MRRSQRKTVHNKKLHSDGDNCTVDTTYSWTTKGRHESIRVGDRVIAKRNVDKEWCRGVIVQIDKTHRSFQHTVQFDDGKTEYLTVIFLSIKG